MKNSKAFMIILVAAFVVGIAWMWWRANSYTVMPVSSNPVPAIQSASDLNKASGDLDSTNIDSMDNELNQINVDQSSF